MPTIGNSINNIHSGSFPISLNLLKPIENIGIIGENIKNIKVRLDAFSIFSNNILIRNILLKDIKVNYYFNYDGLKILDNVRSFQKDLGNKTSNSHSNKYFNIENLDAKNISLAVLSPDLNFEKTFTFDFPKN